MLRRLLIFGIVLMLLFLTIGLSGCSKSKASYEEDMIKLLEDTKAQVDKNLAQIEKLTEKKESKQQAEELKNLINGQINILKETQSKIEKINPPDDFFVGHSDIKEFLVLLISYKEKELVGQDEGTKDVEQSPSGGSTLLNASKRAYDRAKSALPFLEYELQRTFSDLLDSSRSRSISDEGMMLPGFEQSPPFILPPDEVEREPRESLVP